MKKNKDHRIQQRRVAHIIAEYRVKEGQFRDIIKNIGSAGIFISTQRQIAMGQEIEMTFPLFSFQHKIQILGKVVRSGPHGFAVSFDQPINGFISKDGQIADIVHEIDRPKGPEPEEG